jgi:hypothetical protein
VQTRDDTIRLGAIYRDTVGHRAGDELHVPVGTVVGSDHDPSGGARSSLRPPDGHALERPRRLDSTGDDNPLRQGERATMASLRCRQSTSWTCESAGTFASAPAASRPDVFNVTNHDAFYLFAVGANQTFSPLYGQGQQRQTRRAPQISARFLFWGVGSRIVRTAHRQRRRVVASFALFAWMLLAWCPLALA